MLTAEDGKIDAIARGARKAGSRLAGSSDELTSSVMSLATGKKNLYVTQTQPLTSFRGLRRDYDRLNTALAFVELCAAVVPYGEPSPEAYALLVHFLNEADKHDKPLVALIWAETRLLSISGFQPELSHCVDTGDAPTEADVWLSPRAGGCVSAVAAPAYPDRFRARIEVLFGLSRIVDLESPPKNLKYAPESLSALVRFWRHYAEAALPANELVVSAALAESPQS